MPRGGKRAGAGRKPGNHGFEKEEGRRVLRALVWKHMTPLVEAQIANAQGVKYLVARERKGGKFVRLDEARVKAILEGADSEHEVIEVWEKDPSTPAFTDLMNRTLDKPIEQVQAEHSGSVEIKWRE